MNVIKSLAAVTTIIMLGNACYSAADESVANVSKQDEGLILGDTAKDVCTQHGEHPDCDPCEVLGWYEDGFCDSWLVDNGVCHRADPECDTCGDGVCAPLENCRECASDCGSCSDVEVFLNMDGAEITCVPGDRSSGSQGTVPEDSQECAEANASGNWMPPMDPQKICGHDNMEKCKAQIHSKVSELMSHWGISVVTERPDNDHHMQVLVTDRFQPGKIGTSGQCMKVNDDGLGFVWADTIDTLLAGEVCGWWGKPDTVAKAATGVIATLFGVPRVKNSHSIVGNVATRYACDKTWDACGDIAQDDCPQTQADLRCPAQAMSYILNIPAPDQCLAVTAGCNIDGAPADACCEGSRCQAGPGEPVKGDDAGYCCIEAGGFYKISDLECCSQVADEFQQCQPL